MNLIAGYSIIETLYKSERSTIYRALRIDDRLPFVLKVLGAELPDVNEVARLRREYRLTRELAAEGVIGALALERFGTGFAIVLEDCGGESLTRLVRGKSIEPAQCLRIASRVARALGRVHRKHVMHKDVNPSNIIWNPNTDELRLIDFGISAELSRETPAVFSPHLIEGTLPYISPESTGRMNRAIDYRTDFYSLGATLYELLTGRLPFLSKDPLELVHCHIARIPTSPSEINPAIPTIVSDIVLRLMAKVAEDRYQNAFALAADLDRCAHDIERNCVTTFPLGKGDVSDRLEIRQKLYGRDAEIDVLLSTFDRTSEGRAEMMLVAGYSGIGKSAIIHEIHKPILKRRGYFASGKFDQYNRDIPYASLIQAIKDLIRQILTEPKESLVAWQIRMLDAIRPNAQLIIDVIPEVKLIIGEQPAVPELPPMEAQNRFNLMFEKFFGVFANKDHPLAIFLDDLQWADLPSLVLLERLMANPETRHLLLIGAYRDNEITAGHPLVLSLEAIRKHGATIHTITLNPLGVDHCIELLGDALRAPVERVAALAQVCHKKTGGNPFFLRQFLLSLYDSKQIDFDEQMGQFRWDTASINRTPMTDNVVDLMAAKIQKLSADTQRILELAACIGNIFDLRTLSVVADQSPRTTANMLWDALREDLIVPLDDAYKFIDDRAEAENMVLSQVGGQPRPAPHFDHVAYRFLHDRVQQAAYSLIPDHERQAVHLQVGRLMLVASSTAEQHEHLFAIVGHLNLGAALVEGQAERDETAKLNLAAGRKAQASAAQAGAKAYFEAGIALLGEDRWARKHDLALALHTHATEASYLCAAFDDMERHAHEVFTHTSDLLVQVKVYEIKIQAFVIQNRYGEALQTGRQCLSLLGMEFPAQPTADDVAKAIADVHAAIGDRPIETLIDLPPMVDPAKLAASKIIVMMGTSAYVSEPILLLILVLQQVALAARFGNIGACAVGYVSYGVVLSGAFDDIRASHAFGQLALGTLHRYNAREYSARICCNWEVFFRIWNEHLRESYNALPNVYRLGLEVGDLEFAGWSIMWTVPCGLFLGIELSELERNTAGRIVAAAQIKQVTACRYMVIHHQVIQNLMGLSVDPCILSGAVHDEGKALPLYVETNDSGALATFFIYKLLLTYLFGCHDAARECADKARAYLSAIMSSTFIPTFYFFNALTWLALFPNTTGEVRDRAMNEVTEILSRFEKWTAHAPMNFAAKLALIQAEHQRVLGQPELARAAYYRAIALAREHEYRNDEALATELFAAFLRGQQEHEVSRLFLAKARHLYHLWGAEAKVRDIERKFPEIVAMTSAMGKAAEPSSPSTIVTDTRASNSLDLLSAIKASQAISGEVVLPKLLEKLIEIVIENAGARSGLLIMEGDTHLVAEAQRSEQGSTCEVKLYDHLEMVRLDHSPEIIRYVQRTHQAVVLGDASTSAYFKDHSQNSAYRPKSVLCMPILLQKRLVGVLYLENELLSNAFTEDRCKILELLASQAAISLDNAKLYQTLEHKVEQRTRLLQEKNEELSRTLVELRKTQNQLVQSEKMASMGRLTMGIAHELKNPLNFIINFAKIEDSLVSEIDEELEDVRDALPPDTGMIDAVQDLKRAAAGIHEHGVRANDIIQSMMRHAAGVSGERTAFRIDKLLDQAIKLVLESPRVVDSNAKINIECDFDSTVGEVLIVAQEMLCVCINLLENAVDAVLAKKRVNGPAYVPTVRVDARHESNALRIRVHDNGPGIAPSTLSRIFEPFFTTKAPGTGIGLGLSLSYDIVVQGHQGTIECESVEGEGSTFIIRLPT